MKVNKYELDLLIEAVKSRLTKEKRKRGSCDKIYILPTKDVPEDFRYK